MTDFTSLQLKLNDLKAKVANNSITPLSLGSLLDELLQLVQAIDISDLKPEITSAITKAQQALSQSNLALQTSEQVELGLASEIDDRTRVDTDLLSRIDDVHHILQNEVDSALRTIDELGNALNSVERDCVERTRELDGKITDLREDAGILPFAKEVYRVSEAEALEEGSVVYERAEGVFRRRTATGWELAPGYNAEGYLDGRPATYPRLDKVFRCGGTLYRCRIDNLVPGLLAFAVAKDVDALSDRMTSAEYRLEEAEISTNKNASAIARHREEAGVYRFDCVAADVYDIPAADRFEGMVAWDGIDRIFKECTDADENEWQYAGEDFTRENPDSHDNTDVTIPRTDRLFRSGKHLYHVAGSQEEGFRLVRYALVEEVEAVGKQLDTVRESTVDNYQLIKQEQKRREANCDALSDRISSGLSGVGIYPFAGFEDFGLGAGTDEEGEYAPGAVVFSTQTRCFLLKGADGSWQHAGAPYDVTDGGHFVPHTDCLYRLGQSLYRAVYSASDGWCLVRHLDEQDKLALHPRMTFSDDFNYTGTRLAMAEVTERDIEEWERWSIAGGKVNGGFDRATGTWWLNGVTGIGRDEHDMIMMLAWATRDIASGTHALGAKYALAGKLSTLLCRTLMPISYPDYISAPSNFICVYHGTIEVLNFASGDFANIHIHSNPKLRELQGKLNVRIPTENNRICRIEGDSLETVQLVNLAGNLDLGKCPKLSLESVAYIIANRQGTNVITLTLHADVYAALTDEVIDAALKKNVSLAQA